MPIRAYKFNHNINIGKIKKIKDVLSEYRKTSNTISKLQWNLFFKEGDFNKNYKVKNISSNISSRYKQSCQYQVVGILNSYISNRQNDFVKIVYKSNLDEDTKFILFAINKSKTWFTESLKEATLKDKYKKPIKILTIEKCHYKLARKILKYIFKLNKFPTFNYISMQLDEKVAIITKKKEGKAKRFDWWLKLSTLDKGRRIFLPLYKNSYFEKKEGKQLNFVQLNERDNNIEIVFLKDIPKETNYLPKTSKISIDIGLKALFAVNTGDLYGRKIYDYLKYYDKIITDLQSSLQQQNIKPKQNKRFIELNRQLREYIKNEINRLLNKIFKLYQPKQIVIEKLNFQNSNLSPQLNRILSRFGMKIINQKLKNFKEIYGINIIEVNPAYTSQTCSSCGYVDKRNRKTQENFKCLVCGKKINADINASRNIGIRSSNPMKNSKKRSVLNMLVKTFLSDAKFDAWYSRASDVILSNKYFKGFTEPLKIKSKEKS